VLLKCFTIPEGPDAWRARAGTLAGARCHFEKGGLRISNETAVYRLPSSTLPSPTFTIFEPPQILTKPNPQRSHQKLRIKRDRKLASFINHRQRFLGFAHFRRIRYDVDITFRKDQFDRLFARQKRYSAHGGKESLPIEPDPFFRLGRNHLAIIGVTPFDQLGNKQGSVQLKCDLVFADAEFHFTFLTQQTLNFSDCLRRNNDFCFLTAGKLNFELD
jgi:hypothetical protein